MTAGQATANDPQWDAALTPAAPLARPGDAAPTDVADCDREPIHMPGRIQPHGVLLALKEPEFTVVQASANTRDQLGVAGEQLLGRPLAAAIGDEQAEVIRRRIGEQPL